MKTRFAEFDFSVGELILTTLSLFQSINTNAPQNGQILWSIIYIRLLY